MKSGLPCIAAFLIVVIAVKANAFFGQPPSVDAPKVAATQPYLGPRLLVQVVPLISNSDFFSYKQLLVLSKPQSAYIESLLEPYRASGEELIAKNESGREWLSIEGGRAQGAGDWHTSGEFRKRLAIEERQLQQRIQQLDDGLFENIASILSPDQIERLDRVRARRARSRAMLQECYMRGVLTDISSLTTQVMPESTELVEIDRILSDYELSVSPLVTKLDSAKSRSKIEAAPIDADIVDAQRLPSAEKTLRVTELLKKKEQLLKPEARLQRQIVDLNDKTVLAIADALPIETGAQLLQGYREYHYSLVYPDPIDPDSIVNQVISAQELPPAARASIEAQYQAFRTSWEAASRNMQWACNDFFEEFAATFADQGDAKFRTTMRTLRTSRWKLDLAFLDSLLSNIPGDQTVLIERVTRFKLRAREITKTAEADPDYPLSGGRGR
jgi:hypothetical protein